MTLEGCRRKCLVQAAIAAAADVMPIEDPTRDSRPPTMTSLLARQSINATAPSADTRMAVVLSAKSDLKQDAMIAQTCLCTETL